MRGGLSVIVSIVLLAAVSWLLDWFDFFHVAIGLPAIILLLMLLRWWRRRSRIEGEEVIKQAGSMFYEAEDVQESAVRLVLLGLVRAIGILFLLLLIFWSASKTPVYGLFYDTDWQDISNKIAVLEEAQAWPNVIEIADQRLEQRLSPEKQMKLIQIKYNALIAYGSSLNDNHEKLARFEKALLLAKEHGLDHHLAEAEVRAVKAEISVLEALQSPQELPSGSRGIITQIDTSLFPPSLVVYVTIEDGSGAPINWLEKKDFRVTVDDHPVPSFLVANFSEKEAVNVALAMDVSGSIKGVPLEDAKEGAKNLVDSLSREDFLELIAFSEKPRRVLGWTRDKADISSAIDRLKAGGDTAIYDAICLAVDDLHGRTGHKTMVLCTDGEDTSSTQKLDSTIRKAKEAGIPIYTMGLQSKDLDVTSLSRLADETGGTYLEADGSGQLTALYKQIGSKIRNQYRFVLDLSQDDADREHILTITAGSRDGKVRMQRSYQRSGLHAGGISR